jgi:hypothetical protein
MFSRHILHLFACERRQVSRYSNGLQARQPEFDSQQGHEIFYFPWRPDRLWASYTMGSGALKRPGYEADYSPPSSAEDKNGGAAYLLPHTSSWGAPTTFPLPLFVSVRMWLVIFANLWIIIFQCDNCRTEARHATFRVQTQQ